MTRVSHRMRRGSGPGLEPGRSGYRFQALGGRQPPITKVNPGSSAWKPGEMANQDRDAGRVAGSSEVQDMSVAAAWGWCLAGCLTWWWAVAWIAVRLAGG